MKSTFAVIVLFLLCTMTLSAGEKRKFGKELTLNEKTKISDVIADPEKYNGKRIQIEGAVVGVCEKRGCWINVAGDKEGEKLRFKVEDGVIVFPMEIKGKTAAAEGVLNVITYSEEDQIAAGKKEAEEHGTTFDPSTVKGPKTVIQLNGEGAVVWE
jgi:hypothetical protein